MKVLRKATSAALSSSEETEGGFRALGKVEIEGLRAMEAVIVVIDDFPEGGEAAVVHGGSRELDVAQARGAENVAPALGPR